MSNPIMTYNNCPKNMRYKWKFYFGDAGHKVMSLIQMDVEATYSVTDMRSANDLSMLIRKHVGAHGSGLVDLTILDACACVGGNTISFIRHFTHVTAVEISPIRYGMLLNNLAAFGLSCNTVLADICSFMNSNSYVYDVVFLDPPWGGVGCSSTSLSIGDISLSDMCISMRSRAKYIVLKLPLHFDVKSFGQDIAKHFVIGLSTTVIRKTLTLILQ